MDAQILALIRFRGEVIHWRGPSPFFFLPLPIHHADEIRHAARSASYGWGVVPVDATINGLDFQTSLFPKDGSYLLPLKDAVRKKAGISLGDEVGVVVTVRRRQ